MHTAHAHTHTHTHIGKAIPLEAWTDPEGSRRLRLPDFKTIGTLAHEGGKVNTICRGNYGDHQCGFRRNKSTTDHIFCICQILEKKWEHNEAVHQLFTDFKKAYDSVRREALYNILIEFGIPKKLVRLIKLSD